MNPFNSRAFQWGVSSSFQDLYPSPNTGFSNLQDGTPGAEAQYPINSEHGSLRNAFEDDLEGSGQFEGPLNNAEQNTQAPQNSLPRQSIPTEENPVESTSRSRIPARRSKLQDLDWGKHKTKIQELYLTEDRTLEDTMRIMKEAYFFNPS